MYRRLLGRDPERQRSCDSRNDFLDDRRRWRDYAQALLATNEVIFWP